MKNFIISLFAIFTSISLNAEVLMPSIFSDGMVLQRNAEVKIWGKATPKSKIEITFENQKPSTNADDKGLWSLKLSALKENSTPSKMQIFENGKLEKTIQDILVGEVWMSGGQSNMARRVGACDTFLETKSRANYPTMRFFNQPHEAQSPTPCFDSPETSEWKAVTPENLELFTAVGFYFAEALQNKLNVPVGIIESAVGGSGMITWIKEDDAKGITYFDDKLSNYHAEKANYNYENALKKYESDLAKFNADKAKAKAEKKTFRNVAPTRPYQYSPYRMQQTPQFLYNAKIAPVKGYTVSGIIWYQGEGDSRTKESGVFSSAFIRVIETWRKYWENPNLPFYFVELSAYDTEANFPLTRSEQLLTTHLCKNTGLASSVDIGLEKDVHPTNKFDIGKRLAGLALYEVYGKKEIYPYSPEFKDLKKESGKILISFEKSNGELILSGALRGFEVLINEKWETFTPKLLSNNGESILEFADNIDGKKICGVRYLWKGWTLPDVCLRGKNNLPLLPFTKEIKGN